MSLESKIYNQLSDENKIRYDFKKLKKQAKKFRNQKYKIPVTPFCLYKDDIKIVTMAEYIRAEVHRDFNGLVLMGNPTEEGLKECWDTIVMQKAEAMNTLEAQSYNNLVSQIQVISLFCVRVRYNMTALSTIYDESIINELREDGFDFEFSKESYINDLKLVENGIITFEVQLEGLKKEYDKKYKDKKTNTEDDYMNTLADISKHEGYQTPPVPLSEKMTVYDYCMAVGRLQKYHEQQKKENGVH